MTMSFEVVLVPPFLGLISVVDTVTLGDISITNTGDETPTTMYVGLFNALRAGVGGSLSDGQEVINEQWLEVSQDGGATWNAIGGDASADENRIEVIAIPAPGETLAISARFTMPSDATTAGDVVLSAEVFVA